MISRKDSSSNSGRSALVPGTYPELLVCCIRNLPKWMPWTDHPSKCSELCPVSLFVKNEKKLSKNSPHGLSSSFISIATLSPLSNSAKPCRTSCNKLQFSRDVL